MPYLHRQMLEVLGISNANKLVPLKDGDDMKPVDPVSENMAIINGKPVKAFIGQDHEAHITVHTTAMQDPQLAQLMGQNPNAQAMMSAAQAHIMEHLAFAYRKQIEDQAGVPYPAPDAKISADMEVQISRLAAAAAQQVLQKNQAQAAQQQAQQTAQDPIVQMQMQELELKKGELDLKRQKLMLDAVAQHDKIDIEEKRIDVQTQIAGMQVGAKMAADDAKLSAQQQEAGVKMGIEIAKSMSEAVQAEEAMRQSGEQQEVQPEVQPETPVS
jgi:hypothetical protein